MSARMVGQFPYASSARPIATAWAAGVRLIVAAGLLAACGCMHVPLRKNTANEARTVGDLYQQQVLDNLAMFAYDPNSVPYFSYANQGSSSISDQGSVGVAPSWSRLAAGVPFLFTMLGTHAEAQRQAAVAFTLSPVNDPRKLELMRCAYQKAIAGCNGLSASTVCPDCQTRFKTFYTGDADGDINAKASGIVTSECLGSSCWLGIGCKKDVPHGCPCQLVGEHCGVYVWVLPGQSNELAKLTLAILDYALNPFPSEVQKSVSYYIDGRGLPTTCDAAVGVVSANIGLSESNESLFSLSKADGVDLRDKLQKQLEEINRQIGDAQKADNTILLSHLLSQRQLIQSKLDFLEYELPRLGGAKHNYVGGPSAGSVGSPSGPGSFILQLNQAQNALGGVTPRP